MQAKDIFLDLEADLPNLSSVSICCHEKINHFTAKELSSGVRREHICEIYFYSNVKQPVELILCSKNSIDEAFAFIDEEKSRKLPFYLFSYENKNAIGNNAVIFSESNLVEPISKVISLGMIVPKVSKKALLGGLLSMQFTVILKHLG